jgi:phage terminase large subunit
MTVIDEGGLGSGVVDRLAEQRYKVRGVNFGWKANSVAYANKRAEMWGTMREWLKTASIGSAGANASHENSYLKAELCGPEYKLTSNGAIQLESKDSMKKRGVASPDVADALALTFAYPVANRAASKMLKDRVSPRTTSYNQPNAVSWMQ